MTAQAQTTAATAAPTSVAPSSVLRTIALLAAAFVVAGAANAIIAFTALAVGASPTFAPLSAPVFLAFTVLGVAGGYLGWRIVRRLTGASARVMRIVVPVALVLSWIPDVALAILQFIPGTNLTGAVGLALMHAVVVAVAVPVYQRLAPVR